MPPFSANYINFYFQRAPLSENITYRKHFGTIQNVKKAGADNL